MCPYLVPVIADRLWLYPVAAYCRRPDHLVRVPARSTIANRCGTPAYCDCPSYCESATAGSRSAAGH